MAAEREGVGVSVCSVPGCGGDAVLQWTRVSTERESAAHTDRLNGKLAELAEAARGHLELQIADLQSMQHRLQTEGRLTPGAASTLAGQIEARQTQLDGLEVAPALVPEASVAVPVFGCAVHAVGLEEATLVHQVDCSTAGACSCTLTAP
jgi:hypothetical protein